MLVRRGSTTTADGFVQQKNTRRRRNAVANIFSEFSESEVRALRQQARVMLPRAAAVSSSSSSSEDLQASSTLNPPEVQVKLLCTQQRRRRNALHDIGEGIDRAQLQQLREQALAMHHPAALSTTPPGAPGARLTAPAAMTAAGAAASETLAAPDDSGASHLTLRPPRLSPSFIVDSVGGVGLSRAYLLPRSISSRNASDLTDGGSGHQHPPLSAADTIVTITETDGDIFRERISRSTR